MARKNKKEKVEEIFEVEKGGKEKIEKAEGKIPVKHLSKKQLKKQEKLLRNFLIVLGAVIVLFLATYLIVISMRSFDYKGVEFEVIKEGEIILYKTSFPVMYNGEKADYNIFLRTNPKKLEKEVPFHGQAELKNNLVLNMTGDFNCDGDGIIAIANLQQFYGLGGNVIQDPNATCSENGEYSYVHIMPGEENEIVQMGPACYDLKVIDCGILEVTERFMLELFVEANKR